MARSDPSSAHRVDREFAFTEKDFHEIRKLVAEHTGIALSDAKRELVYGRLSRRLRVLGLSRFADYRALLVQSDSPELGEFVNSVTTNLTAFFRERHHFDYFQETALPELVRRKDMQRRLRFWSAGCSTGAEPYSMAMVVAEFFANKPGWDVKILATDLDTNCLRLGHEGLYSVDQLRGVEAARLRKWFTRIEPNQFQAVDQLREMVVFNQLNLMKEWPMRGPMDAIFCRNVVIYFDKPTQQRIFNRFAALMRPDEHLFIGHSESLYRVSDAFKLIGKTIYRRL